MLRTTSTFTLSTTMRIMMTLMEDILISNRAVGKMNLREELDAKENMRHLSIRI